MNVVNFKIKLSEESSYYKTSHRRYRLKLQVRNMSKEQKDKLEKAIRKAVMDILPDMPEKEKKWLEDTDVS